MKVVILITFSLLLFSCGKKDQRSTVKLRISSSGLVNGNPMNGGLIVMGKSRTTPQSFSLDGHADMQVELDKGAWDFYVIGWEGNPSFTNESFTGQIRCAYKAKVLESAEEEIGFNLSNSNCLNKIPPPRDFYLNAPSLLLSSNIPKLIISTCIDANSTTIPATYDNSCDYSLTGANAGLGKSFKVKKYYSIGSKNGPQQQAGTDESQCFPRDTNTNMRLPLGDPIAQEGLPSWEIISYTEAGCAGDFIKYRFDRGLVNGPKHPDQKSAVRISATDGVAYLLLEHNPLTVSHNGPQANHFFGNGFNGPGYELSINLNNHEARIIGINIQGDTLTVPSGEASIFYAGDEIMWYVNDCYGSGCTSGFLPGRYGYGYVKSSNGNNTITLLKTIHLDTQYGQLTLPTNTTLGAAVPDPSTSGDWLSMQVIKVHNFLNFSLLSTAADVPQYSESLGKGGILAMKVKNNFIANASTYSLKMNADGKGRVRNHSINYSHCTTGQPCLQLGAGDGTYRGGGIMMITAKNLRYSTDATNDLSFTANGTSNSATDGGIIIARFGTLVYDHENYGNNVSFSGNQFEANGSANPAAGSGTGGYARFDYCNEESPYGTNGSPPTSSTGSGPNGTVEVFNSPGWCQSL